MVYYYVVAWSIFGVCVCCAEVWGLKVLKEEEVTEREREREERKAEDLLEK